MALKLVLWKNGGNNVGDLECEKIYMQQAKVLCPESVMEVAEEGFTSFDNLGGALLLSNVGVVVSKKRYKDLILSLAGLHENGIIHGNPRMQNAVFVDESLYWIDFRKTKLAMHSCLQQQADMQTLLWSLGVSAKESKEYVKDYDGTADQANAIVTSVDATVMP